MKITKSQLKQIIKEELKRIMEQAPKAGSQSSAAYYIRSRHPVGLGGPTVLDFFETLKTKRPEDVRDILNDYWTIAGGKRDSMGGGLPTWLTQEYALSMLKQLALGVLDDVDEKTKLQSKHLEAIQKAFPTSNSSDFSDQLASRLKAAEGL